MRIPLRLLGLAVVTLPGGTCAFPTDDSENVFVTISAPSFVVRRGEKVEVSARMYHAAGPDSAEIQNVRFLWTTDNDGIATVEGTGRGAAEVTGVNSGLVNILARAVAFERAETGRMPLRVSNPLEVDSVVPDTVRYGEIITLYGVGVDSTILAALGPATLIEYPFSRSRDAQGLSRISYWVPPPARTDSVFFIGNGVFDFARDTTVVRPFDYLEPNNTTWRTLDLEASPPFPLLPAVRFFNPALAFEPFSRDLGFGADWYRLRQSRTRDITIIVHGEEVRGTFSTFLTDSLGWDGTNKVFFIGADSWSIGPQSHACHGYEFAPVEVPPESTVVALKDFADTSLHAIAIYGQTGRYGLSVIEGYVISKGGFPADAREEDDYCDAADAKGPPYPTGLREQLTIDNAHDVDWIRFRVVDPLGGGLPQVVRFRTASLLSGDTLSDIDLYVLTVPGGGASGTLDEVGSGLNVGSTEDFTLTLAEGHYYAVVVDFAGVPVPYAICVRTCADPFPAGGAPTASRTPVADSPGAKRRPAGSSAPGPLRVRAREPLRL
jgi:hypothetical protein